MNATSEAGIIALFKNKTARENMARGIAASFLGMFVMACSGCGGGGESSTQATNQASVVQPSGSQIIAAAPVNYADGRPGAAYRLNAKDYGIVLRHGACPNDCDALGARDVFVYQSGGTYYMNYDGAGPTGWLASLATSSDLINWTKKGAVLPLGEPQEQDSASASYGTTYFDGTIWHMFYLGTPNSTPAPERIPDFPYLTMKAEGMGPAGPWTKQKTVVPFRPTPGTYYSQTASPGHIVKQGDTYLQFFSSTGQVEGKSLRTISIARTKDLDGGWAPDKNPALPMAEQIENSSIYYQESTKTWFLFTNHVGITPNNQEYTDAVWVYWTQDLEKWDPTSKAVVIDSTNSKWSKAVIGLPSVIKLGDRLAILYDGYEGDPNAHAQHMQRDIGLAYIDLPINTP